MSKKPAPYDKLAADYDRRWRWYIAQTLAFLKASISFDPSERILDIGCGTGELERLILSENPEQRIIGIDISEKMLGLARKKCSTYSTATFLRANASALPFPDHSFDLVVSASAFHYFDPPMACLREMRRVLAPRGSAVILDWCKDYLTCRLFDLVLKRIEPGYYACYTQRDFHRLLISAGFEIRSAGKVRFGWTWGLMKAVGGSKLNLTPSH
jgi:ubiquinone/menaquinone biosynthesis C-methylase UbiE